MKILITGMSSGIGYELSKRLGEHELYCTTTSREKQLRLQKEFPNAKLFQCDVSDKAQVDDMFDQIKSLDVLVNNAGVKASGKIEDIRPCEFQRVMDVNLMGPYYMMQRAIPILNKGGKIINIASTIGTRSGAFLSPYSASKHALVGLSHSVRDELIAQEKEIYVSTVYPGATDTPFNDGRSGMLEVREIVDGIEYVMNRDKACVDLFVYPKMEKRKP